MMGLRDEKLGGISKLIVNMKSTIVAILIIAITFFVVFFTCKYYNTDSATISYFGRLDKTLSKQKRIELKACKEIRCILFFTTTLDSTEFEQEFSNIPIEMSHLLDSIGFKDNRDRNVALLIGYHKYLNDVEYSFSNIKEEIGDYTRKLEIEDSIISKRLATTEKVLWQMAQSNYDSYDIGDTLCLHLPLNGSGFKKSVVLFTEYSSDNFTDTLYVKCILTKKEIEDMSTFDSNLHDFFNFTITILETKQNSSCLNSSGYDIGKEKTLDIFYYGRPIEACNWF
jgi:hypothetical protein